MLNNLLFFFSTGVVVLLAGLALKQGKEALYGWIAFQGIAANLFVLKQITLFGFNATASDVFAVGSLFSLNLLRRHYGGLEAKRAIHLALMGMIAFCGLGQLHLCYQPSPLDSAHAAYYTLLAPNPRLMLASVTVFFIVQHFDNFLYGQLQRTWLKDMLLSLNIFTLLISQGLDTLLFSLFGLYGLVQGLTEIMWISYLIKVCAIAALVPFMQLQRNWKPI
jgi:uncharacterized integral membrane protein (TIGR00697 family)